MPKLDWTRRESVRADLRRHVRRLLARYGYPPDLSEDATQLVLKQASYPRPTEVEPPVCALPILIKLPHGYICPR
jgi:hypothetical protein